MKGIFIILLMITSLITSAQQRCGTEIYTKNMIKENASYAKARHNVNSQTEKWIKNHPNHAEKTIITIPVVVHVVWKINAHNISDAQIQSQIDVLNEDYRRTNIDKIYAAGDVTNVPYKQIIIAMGEGAKVGLTAFEDLMIA